MAPDLFGCAAGIFFDRFSHTVIRRRAHQQVGDFIDKSILSEFDRESFFHSARR